jgi:hypothetical protein
MFIDFVAKAKTAPRQAPVTADAPLMRACCFDPATGTLQPLLNYSCCMIIPSHNFPPSPPSSSDTFSVRKIPIPEPGPLDVCHMRRIPLPPMNKCNIFQVRVRVSACSLNPVDAKVKPLLFLSRILRRSQPLPLQAAQWKGMSPDMTSAHVCGLDVSGDKPFPDPSPPAVALMFRVETELSYCR